jgi:hypothetical protein
MTIPVYVLGAICLVTNCYLSDKWQRRGPFLVGCAIPVMIGYLICVGSSNSNAGLAGMFILVTGKPFFASKSCPVWIYLTSAQVSILFRLSPFVGLPPTCLQMANAPLPCLLPIRLQICRPSYPDNYILPTKVHATYKAMPYLLVWILSRRFFISPAGCSSDVETRRSKSSLMKEPPLMGTKMTGDSVLCTYFKRVDYSCPHGC